jgi:hypothetical protein
MDQPGVYGVASKTFFTNQTGAEFIADVLPGIYDGNAVTHGS